MGIGRLVMFGEGFQGGTSGKEPTANARDTEMKV